MGLKKLCLTAGIAVLGSLLFAPGALAWTFSASGSAVCDRTTGEHVITWSIDNRTEPEALTIRESNRPSVPVGSTAAARSVQQYGERIAGTVTGTITLIAKGNWPSDRTLRTRTASLSLSATCLADVCPNIEGVQTQLPSGMVKSASGDCITPPRDQCPNLAGVQEQVPAGMAKDVAGICFTPPTDVCPNIEGVQTQVPSGMVENTAGNCVAPPTDLCPNLTGAQQDEPAGMARDVAGNCFTPPTDLCPNIEGLQEQVPAGMVTDTEGRCITTPPDQCPNLAEVQEQVPAGMAKDTEGNCFTPPTDLCPNIEGLQAALPEGFVKEESGICSLPPRIVTVTERIETTITVPGLERVVTVSAAPVTLEKIVRRVVKTVVVKRAKVARKKIKQLFKRTLKRRVLPFTPK